MVFLHKVSPMIRGKVANKNSRFVLLIFVITILFQATMLKYIWSLESVARITNILVLGLLIIYTTKVIATGCYSQKIWHYYLIPGMLVLGGLFLNISINTLSNFKLISFYGQTLPWLTYLIIPAQMKKEAINTKTLWRYFYYFMLWASILGLLDYILVFYGGQNLRILTTPYGIFGGGSFSLLYMLENGTVHHRYYSCFGEPGTLAMFLLPAMTYAFFHKKYYGLTILSVAFYLTYSLGGIISLFMLLAIISFVLFNRKKKYFLFALLAIFTITILLWINFGNFIFTEYEGRGNSAKVREASLTNTLTKIPELVMNNPLGLRLAEDTNDFERNKLYVGSNFSPGVYLQYGGIMAMIGYLICLFVSFSISLKNIKRYDLTLEQKVVFSSIIVTMPFIFQRTTLWESALFALLFAPTIIMGIQSSK